MKEIQYKNFSLRVHKKNWRTNRPNQCQFELTFRCDFHCLYCYCDCYNNPANTKNELSTEEVKFILDKVYDTGCLWLCLTGGDPFKREDFLEIYSYAKQKGFIITIFTNGYSLTREIADFLKDNPPFVVELTINSVTKNTFEEISQVPDSYEKTFENLNMLIERKIPLSIKTMVIKNNLAELPKIEEFIKGLGLDFNPSPLIYARLNSDTYPCSLRVNPLDFSVREDAANLDSMNHQENPFCNQPRGLDFPNRNTALFSCQPGDSDGFYIDPYGKMVFCFRLREPSIDLLKQDIKEAVFGLFAQMRKKSFTGNSPCAVCQIRRDCRCCPGGAFLETGDMESAVDWFCQWTNLIAERNNSANITNKTYAKRD